MIMGFSRGLMSMATPRACLDSVLVPATFRKLNTEVLSAAIAASSSPPNASTGFMRAIGK
jgi:hypothetical protein